MDKKIFTTEDIKKYQKLGNQKLCFYFLFTTFWVLTLLFSVANHSIVQLLHDTIFLLTMIMILGIYFTRHKMQEMLK